MTSSSNVSEILLNNPIKARLCHLSKYKNYTAFTITRIDRLNTSRCSTTFGVGKLKLSLNGLDEHLRIHHTSNHRQQ